jgi:hypothetical protein
MTTSRNKLLYSALGGCLVLGTLVGFARSDEKATIGSNATGMHESHAAAAASMPAQPARPGEVQWDEKASKDLEASLHQLHEIWNNGDIASLKQFIIGDAWIPTFELDPMTHKPIKLESKADLDGFISRTVTAQDDRHLVTQLDMPKLRCRATATWGFCTEECSVNYKAQSGELLGTDKLWSTQIAINTPEGWRWIQWHMSDATPPQSVNIH